MERRDAVQSREDHPVNRSPAPAPPAASRRAVPPGLAALAALATLTALSSLTARSDAGTPCGSRFTIAGGQVTDHGTGLVWQQSPSGPSNGSAWLAAHDGCAKIGYRLPNALELQTIVDDATGTLAAGFGGKKPAAYWSITPSTGGRYFWVYTTGAVQTDAPTKLHDYRCVK
jgi:hypothetical protein